jgi:hypothetical protein
MREALVWNFEDDNFTWMDAAVDNTTFLEPVVCIQYQPDPGWQVRWSDWAVGGDLESTWAALATTKWSDLYSGPAEENIYWLTKDGVHLADQTVKTDGIKEYFTERQRLDLNDIVESFTTNKWIVANNFKISVGWTNTLMDTPDYLVAATINLQTRQNNGRVKYDFRSTGRYLALAMFFNQTAGIRMTGAEIDVEQTHGR